ncbi:MAG: signal peptide peptidase SppA, partial [Stellaceae bacterium]
MRRIAVGFFAGVGVLAVLLIIAVAIVIIRLKPGTPALPGNIILSVDLTQGLADRPDQGGWLELIVGAKPTLRDFLDAIEAAGDDPRVKGLVARIGSDQFALAEAQQIRDAIRGFRAKGKFAIAFSDSFGEFGGGTRPYYLASAFDRIWLQPMGTVGLTG